MSRKWKKQQPGRRIAPKDAIRGALASEAVQEEQERQSTSSAPANGTAAKSARRGWEVIGVCLLLLILVFIVFGRTAGYGFVNFDDNDYVQSNPMVSRGLSLGGLEGAFTHVVSANWHPLTMIVHMLDCQMYGLWPGGHHLANVSLHAACSVLLFLLLMEMTGTLWRSALVAALFAIHPLRVESVVWISELKDVLSGLFFMLTLWAYARYARHSQSRSRYGMVILWFALGLLSKPMLVTVPFVLLILDYWPLNRFKSWIQFRALLMEKLPLFVLSVLSCGATVFAQKQVIKPLTALPFSVRIGNALVAYAVYLGKLIYPAHLALFYPLARGGPEPWQVLDASLLLAALSAGALILRRRQPWLLAGWLWYLGMLVPVIGILQVGGQAYADRYTYLPEIGLCIAGTWMGADWAGQWRARQRIVAGLAVVILCVLVVASRHQVAYWRDNEILWRHTLECTRDNYVAHNNLGDVLVERGRQEEGIAEYREALRINPDYASAHNNLGIELARQGRAVEAAAEYREALRSDPADAEAHYNLGNFMLKQQHLEEAVSEFRAALQIKPDYVDAHCNLGVALLQEGKPGEAIAECREALRIDPAYAVGYGNLGDALSQEGKAEEAVAAYREALRINPAYREAHYNLGNALLQKGRIEEAIAEYRETLRIDPAYAYARNNLGMALGQQGREEDSIAQFREALRFNPADAEAHYNLGNALLQQGHTEEAIAEYRGALHVDPAYAAVHGNLGVALLRQGRLEEAIAEYREALRANPSDAGAHGNLGLALFQEGKSADAIAEYREALGIDPDDANAHYNLGNALLQQGRIEEAIVEMQKALDAQPSNPAIQDRLAWILATARQASLRNGQRSVQLASQASQASGGANSSVLRTLAAAYAEAGDFPNAVQTAQKALQLAVTQGNSSLADALRRDIKLYESGHPFDEDH